MAAWNEAPAGGGLGECAALVRSAESLRFSAPELAVQLARRALIVGAAESAGAADVGQAKVLSMRAQAVLASGLVRMSHYVDAVEPAFAALALAEGEGVADVATAVRLDLAACSREVGEPLLGCAMLRPVFELSQSSSWVRAIALGRLVGCIAHVGRRDDVEDALAEADRLLAADEGLGPDARRMERARLSVRAAAYHRWYGDTEDAADAAREGLTQLNRLRGLRAETARLRAQLVLELACALLDEGALDEAASVSEAVLAEPVRATSAAAVGQLMLAVATRVHLPAGRVDRGRGLLDQTVWMADRHGLDGLLADALTAVSQLDEAAERPAEALESVRAARAAEQRRLRAMAQATRRLLMEENPAKWDAKAVNALLRSVVRATGQQPATRDWHLAAQRVTQSARQQLAQTQTGQSQGDGHTQQTPLAEAEAAKPTGQPESQQNAQPDGLQLPRLARPLADQSAESNVGQSAGDQAWPTEQPDATQSGERPAAARAAEQPAARPAEQPAEVAPDERFAIAQSNERLAAQWGERPAAKAEPPAAERSSESLTAAQSHESVDAGRSSEQPTERSAGELVSAAADRMHQQTEMDAATGLLSKEGLIRRLRSVRNGDRPVALTLVRLDRHAGSGRFADPGTRPGTAADFELSELAGRVRDIVPDDAELARSDGTELAVVLPHTTRDQAERFAAAIESAWLGTANGHSISTGVVQSNPDAPTVDARALINAARHALTPAVAAHGRVLPASPDTAGDLADLDDLDDPGDTLRIGRAIISSLSIPTGSGGKRRVAEEPQQPDEAGESTSPPARTDSTAEWTSGSSAEPTTGPDRMGGPVESTAGSLAESAAGPDRADVTAGRAGGSSVESDARPDRRDVLDDWASGSPGESAAGLGRRGASVESTAGSSAERRSADTSAELMAWPLAEVRRADTTVESTTGQRDELSRTGRSGEPTTGEPTRSAGRTDSSTEPTLRSAGWPIPPAGRTGSTAEWPGGSSAEVRRTGTSAESTAGLSAEATAGPTDEATAVSTDEATAGPTAVSSAEASAVSTGPGAALAAGSTAGSTDESATGALQAGPGLDAANTTYEQTKAELALMMSALAAGEAPVLPKTVPPPTFEPTSLPAPSRPAEDQPRNGTALPRQSIPTTPDPDEIPEPERRPDIPQPVEPEPIPPAPPDPGPQPPDETGPAAPPPSGGTRTTNDRRAGMGRLAAAFAADPDTPGDSGMEIARRRRGGLAAAFGSRSGTAGPDQAASDRAADHTSANNTAANNTTANNAAPDYTANNAAPDYTANNTAPDRTADNAVLDHGAADHRANRTAVDNAALEHKAVNNAAVDSAAHKTDEGTRVPRSERSSGSTTIAGLLAEALAAYQETSDEPEPKQREPQRDNDFDRLFDWRYQAPASGRHRSPE